MSLCNVKKHALNNFVNAKRERGEERDGNRAIVSRNEQRRVSDVVDRSVVPFGKGTLEEVTPRVRSKMDDSCVNLRRCMTHDVLFFKDGEHILLLIDS